MIEDRSAVVTRLLLNGYSIVSDVTINEHAASHKSSRYRTMNIGTK